MVGTGLYTYTYVNINTNTVKHTTYIHTYKKVFSYTYIHIHTHIYIIKFTVLCGVVKTVLNSHTCTHVVMYIPSGANTTIYETSSSAAPRTCVRVCVLYIPSGTNTTIYETSPSALVSHSPSPSHDAHRHHVHPHHGDPSCHPAHHDLVNVHVDL